jgi:N4-gp56 family major capsid protein
VLINELSHATRRHKGVSDQRIPWDVGMQMNDALIDWWAERLDTVAFNHLCGNTTVTDDRFTGNNAIVAPSSGRIIWSSASNTSDQTLASTDVFTLSQIDRARELATTGGSTGMVRMRPIKAAMVGGGYGDMFVCFLHPAQLTQLRTSSTGQWREIQNNLLTGGYIKDNPIFTGAEGVYNKTLLVSSEFITKGINSGTGVAVNNTRRAVFCGAQALALAFGKGYGPDNGKVTEETFDYGREVGQNLINVYGIKKTRFNSADYGTIVISSYAADAA